MFAKCPTHTEDTEEFFYFFLSVSVVYNYVLRFGSQFLIHSIDAPSSIHRPSIIRSSGVIPVLLPRGMAIVVTV